MLNFTLVQESTGEIDQEAEIYLLQKRVFHYSWKSWYRFPKTYTIPNDVVYDIRCFSVVRLIWSFLKVIWIAALDGALGQAALWGDA